MLVETYEQVVRALQPRERMRGRPLPEPGAGGRLRVIGLGKIAAEMCPPDLARGALLVLPADAPAPEGARVVRGAHPLPDEGSLAAGEAMLAEARACSASDAVLLLISGGGSALAEVPHDLDLPALRAMNQALVRSGAPIEEMNCVRAHLSRLKGGGLARALHAAGVTRARAYVAVDVPVGGVRAVSSGPAAADPTTCGDAAALAAKYSLPRARFHETLKPGEPADLVEHEAIVDLRSPALEAARSGAALLDSPVRGGLEAFAHRLAALPAGAYCASGELEVAVPAASPPGGRDQHLALVMARLLRGREAGFLAAGTDGRDGNTGNAGAEIDGRTWDEAERRGLDPAGALAHFDATRVLEALGCALPARHTGAHAGDLYLLRLE
ncbi:MAG TPA: DUF4147 domain-containing protein [Myxococcales bacterium]|nr:DUF4147 domain-containing protein [Myxococcales bacterium]